MANFSGTLNVNSAYNALFNAYRLITTIGDNLEGLETTLADRYKVSAGQYEDKLVYTFVDVLKSRVWDPTDANVLQPEDPAPISQQEIVVNKKRQIGLGVPANFLTRQAWANAGNFDTFQSVVEAQVGNTRRLYDQRLVNTYIGTTKATTGSQAQTVTLTGTNDGLTIAEAIANIEVELKDSSRDYNDKGYMVATEKGSFDIIFNSKFANKIKNVDLPTIFHKDGLFDFKDVLPARYFGTPNTSSKTTADANTRALEECTIAGIHYFPGDKIASGASLTGVKSYQEDANVICKIIHKDAVKYASAIETETEYFNPKNHHSNRYLTWMYGEPDRLAVRPFVTLSKA